jgi:hypothetical protein
MSDNLFDVKLLYRILGRNGSRIPFPRPERPKYYSPGWSEAQPWVKSTTTIQALKGRDKAFQSRNITVVTDFTQRPITAG